MTSRRDVLTGLAATSAAASLPIGPAFAATPTVASYMEPFLKAQELLRSGRGARLVEDPFGTMAGLGIRIDPSLAPTLEKVVTHYAGSAGDLRTNQVPATTSRVNEPAAVRLPRADRRRLAAMDLQVPATVAPRIDRLPFSDMRLPADIRAKMGPADAASNKAGINGLKSVLDAGELMQLTFGPLSTVQQRVFQDVEWSVTPSTAGSFATVETGPGDFATVFTAARNLSVPTKALISMVFRPFGDTKGSRLDIVVGNVWVVPEGMKPQVSVSVCGVGVYLPPPLASIMDTASIVSGVASLLTLFATGPVGIAVSLVGAYLTVMGTTIFVENKIFGDTGLVMLAPWSDLITTLCGMPMVIPLPGESWEAGLTKWCVNT